MVVQLEDPAMALLGIVSTMSLVTEPKAGIGLTSLRTKVQPLGKLVVVIDGVTAVFTLLVRVIDCLYCLYANYFKKLPLVLNDTQESTVVVTLVCNKCLYTVYNSFTCIDCLKAFVDNNYQSPSSYAIKPDFTVSKS